MSHYSYSCNLYVSNRGNFDWAAARFLQFVRNTIQNVQQNSKLTALFFLVCSCTEKMFQISFHAHRTHSLDHNSGCTDDDLHFRAGYAKKYVLGSYRSAPRERIYPGYPSGLMDCPRKSDHMASVLGDDSPRVVPVD